MSAQYPVRGQKSNRITWEGLEKKITANFKKGMVNLHFNNMGSFGPSISERMKQTRKRYRKGQKGYKEK